MLGRTSATCLVIAWLIASVLLTAQGITYVYDKAGRLTAVVNASGESAVYTYDAVGDLLSITRRPTGTVSVIEFTPDAGSAGTGVTIYGTGFSTTPGSNTVQFNGTTATVTASTTTTLITSVPNGATSGLISVTAPLGSATSSRPFTIAGTGAPTISGFTPNIGTAGVSFTISGTNFETSLANNQVELGVSRAPLSSSTSTSIGAAVRPRGARAVTRPPAARGRTPRRRG
jgi:YD repeat-containing protein